MEHGHPQNQTNYSSIHTMEKLQLVILRELRLHKTTIVPIPVIVECLMESRVDARIDELAEMVGILLTPAPFMEFLTRTGICVEAVWTAPANVRLASVTIFAASTTATTLHM